MLRGGAQKEDTKGDLRERILIIFFDLKLPNLKKSIFMQKSSKKCYFCTPKVFSIFRGDYPMVLKVSEILVVLYT